MFYKDRDIRGAIFDIDGTIIDSPSLYHQYLNQELERIGCQLVSKDFLFRNLGMGISLRDILRKVISDSGKDEIVEAIADGILEQFMKVDMEIALLSGVKETFSFLKAKGVKIGLATGRTSSAAYEWKRFTHIDLAVFINAIVTAAEVDNRKPAPDIIAHCAKKLHIVPENCIVVGDSTSDVIAARVAGAIPVAVCTGVDDIEKLKEAGPEAVIERLDSLMGCFNRTKEQNIPSKYLLVR
ncbi:MAG: HAD family phosphatase [Deltaproteobacteria bacterium]|nr:HAD family phosphatase [Deltaproteobacteria bacterium]